MRGAVDESASFASGFRARCCGAVRVPAAFYMLSKTAVVIGDGSVNALLICMVGAYAGVR